MKYYSEILKKAFDTEADCLKAEKEYNAKLSAKKAAEEKLAKERKDRAKEVEEALKKAQDAKEEYIKLLDNFCKDYGSFHFSYSSDKFSPSGILVDFLNWF